MIRIDCRQPKRGGEPEVLWELQSIRLLGDAAQDLSVRCGGQAAVLHSICQPLSVKVPAHLVNKEGDEGAGG